MSFPRLRSGIAIILLVGEHTWTKQSCKTGSLRTVSENYRIAEVLNGGGKLNVNFLTHPLATVTQRRNISVLMSRQSHLFSRKKFVENCAKFYEKKKNISIDGLFLNFWKWKSSFVTGTVDFNFECYMCNVSYDKKHLLNFGNNHYKKTTKGKN